MHASLLVALLAASASAPASSLRAPRTSVRAPSTAARAQNDYYSFRRANGEVDELERPAAEPEAPEAPEAEEPEGARGQAHYHDRHKEEIRNGIFAHLQEMGLTLFEDITHLIGGDGAKGFSETNEHRDLTKHAREMEKHHLRKLLESQARVGAMTLESEETGVFLDWTRQKVSEETMDLLFRLARAMEVPRKIAQMKNGERINTSERRAVLHTALRARREDANRVALGTMHPNIDTTHTSQQGLQHNFVGEGVAIDRAIRASCDVRDRLLAFADAVRKGETKTAFGGRFENVVVVGIGGSYLGPEFIVQATQGAAAPEADGEPLEVRFVANVDPVAFDAATRNLDPTTTLVIVVSKSWTTAETLRNARKTRDWLVGGCLARDPTLTEADVVRTHFVACASRTAAAEVDAWGVDSETRLFEFWNWVGGRYSSSSSAGVLPLALSRGSTAARQFLEGARAMDAHFFEAPLEENVPAIMALLGIWNVNFLGLGSRAVVPYSEALARFAAHVQQLEMESHGKSVTIDGRPLDFVTGEIVIGEPGTNAQHSFFQLLHQGQAVPTDFIGFLRPDDASADAEGHDELMANFFAQPDALAVGRAFEDVLDDARFGNGDVENCPHRTLSGDRPSLTLLLDKLDAFHVGALLALYEHRCAIQGFVWDINSFDQWGVQLGKDLADDIRNHINGRGGPAPNPSTAALLERYKAA
eukprot:CAMPEP_0119274664 /NCGR_PEP_ID=MMETSP1329-20130426/12591_1 /TAXON_ID=114041 /ORGANISM="Genus nov. species nov., Strain RCC1024" /LENGTH=702 /DNA_ID=CAMNT_0007275003 /DNA_START=91 /DNA_END=2196 /DNA_ORIENTATION=+